MVRIIGKKPTRIDMESVSKGFKKSENNVYVLITKPGKKSYLEAYRVDEDGYALELITYQYDKKTATLIRKVYGEHFYGGWDLLYTDKMGYNYIYKDDIEILEKLGYTTELEPIEELHDGKLS